MKLRVEEREGAVRFAVRAQPRASRSEVVGEHGDALRVRLAAPPVEGEANDELVRCLAKWLDLPRSAIRLVAGATGRNKIVEVSGIDAAAIHRALGHDTERGTASSTGRGRGGAAGRDTGRDAARRTARDVGRR